jgi:hypothetical protein
MTQGVIEDDGLFTTMDVVSTDGFRQNVSSPAHRSESQTTAPRYFGGLVINIARLQMPLLPSISFCAVNVVRHSPKRRPDQ